MLSRVLAAVDARRPAWLFALRRFALRRGDLSALARRLANFWVVWSALLLIHETGHAVGAWRQGLTVRRITAGVGPTVWQGSQGSTEVVLRLVPVVGMTTFGREGPVVAGPHDGRNASWASWRRELTTIAGGILATLALAVAVAVVVALVERGRGRRWRWGRYVVADAVVLTLFNFLPVPPLDGGRAVVGALGALGGVHLTGDTLFWVHLGGLALAVMPMTVWTRWTRRIDAAAFHWGAPAPVDPRD